MLEFFAKITKLFAVDSFLIEYCSLSAGISNPDSPLYGEVYAVFWIIPFESLIPAYKPKYALVALPITKVEGYSFLV